MSKGLEALKKLKDRADHDEYLFRQDTNREKAISFLNENDNFVNIIEKELRALEIISQNFKLVGNCLHAKNKYAKDGWVFVKELEDEEEHNAWKEVLI